LQPLHLVEPELVLEVEPVLEVALALGAELVHLAVAVPLQRNFNSRLFSLKIWVRFQFGVGAWARSRFCSSFRGGAE
jgi:hypothetical protein